MVESLEKRNDADEHARSVASADHAESDALGQLLDRFGRDALVVDKEAVR
jgi:hypothetical protein